jgi:hypothetical protein
MRMSDVDIYFRDKFGNNFMDELISMVVSEANRVEFSRYSKDKSNIDVVVRNVSNILSSNNINIPKKSLNFIIDLII